MQTMQKQQKIQQRLRQRKLRDVRTMTSNKSNTIKKKKTMLQALTNTLGIVTTATKKTGINRKTHYEWINNDPTYKKNVDDINEQVIDLTESKLHSLIKKENPAAVFFHLKTKAKHRGYIERTETHDVTPNQIWTVFENAMKKTKVKK